MKWIQLATNTNSTSSERRRRRSKVQSVEGKRLHAGGRRGLQQAEKEWTGAAECEASEAGFELAAPFKIARDFFARNLRVSSAMLTSSESGASSRSCRGAAVWLVSLSALRRRGRVGCNLSVETDCEGRCIGKVDRRRLRVCGHTDGGVGAGSEC
ncbi:hypothetical protein PIB30_017187 [Stylosanthes scabra]|uniref:Uncharacterized protein n=1 Tax=Stylosanthes scabra TaxID=79078 RepID=A0ABU6X5V1_9FABA|nr:hypothetical protein [Stylosanthes scabra]